MLPFVIYKIIALAFAGNGMEQSEKFIPLIFVEMQRDIENFNMINGFSFVVLRGKNHIVFGFRKGLYVKIIIHCGLRFSFGLFRFCQRIQNFQ